MKIPRYVPPAAAFLLLALCMPKGIVLSREYVAASEFRSKSIPANALSRAYTSEMAESDRLLAHIFGSPEAVAAANGFEPTGLASQYPFYRGDLKGADGITRRGHLSWAMHLYGNADGTATTPIYVPAGYISHSKTPTQTDAAVTFFYRRLGTLANVTLAVFHVANFSIVAENGRVRIGEIGGRGGSFPSYKHSHIEFYSGNVGLPPASRRPALRIDPTVVFRPTIERIAKK